MYFCGINKTTLLDYPGHVAATLFTGGCNMRCPFCQNSTLVLAPQEQPEILDKEVLDFLRRRQGILEGVCITGGEPSLQPGLADFIRRVRELGYLVKLDTNGYRPQILKELLEERLLDYVAMDIKSSKERYGIACGLPEVDLQRIEESVELLKISSVPYEFRTTVVKGIHSPEEFTAIGQWLQGCRAYYLQSFCDSAQVMQPGFAKFGRVELEGMRERAAQYISRVELRGLV
ncbi:MAG: anaerobic ribonucleoside-triphosphate reductase activating protein [Acetatifactor sp.]|nr:anaerobic ribonucleoside-triphosphate reductase activating protein [Acetatifactor sp.]